MKRISKSKASPARRMALEIVHQVLEKGAYTQVELERVAGSGPCSPEDWRLAAEIGQGTIRMKGLLDWLLQKRLDRTMERQNPWVRSVLRMSAYQLWFLDRIPAYACINDAVHLVREKTGPQLAGLANAVLRKLAADKASEQPLVWSDPAEEITVGQSLPGWIASMLIQRFGLEETRRMAKFFNATQPMFLRVNRLRCTREQLVQSLQEQGVDALPSERHPDSIRVRSGFHGYQKLNAWQQGCFYIQNEASMLAAMILQPGRDERVLDLCCGTGGKSSHLAEVSADQARVLAVDLYPTKIAVLEQTMRRLGINGVTARAADVMELPSDWRWPLILLDAPCSGLGVLGRRADLRWRLEPSRLEDLIELQRALLERAAGWLEAGGSLLYITCTLNKRENEGVVQEFLAEHPDYHLEGFDRQLEFMGLQNDDAAASAQGMLTLLPGRYDTDGMFFALIHRNE